MSGGDNEECNGDVSGAGGGGGERRSCAGGGGGGGDTEDAELRARSLFIDAMRWPCGLRERRRGLIRRCCGADGGPVGGGWRTICGRRPAGARGVARGGGGGAARERARKKASGRRARIRRRRAPFTRSTPAGAPPKPTPAPRRRRRRRPSLGRPALPPLGPHRPAPHPPDPLGDFPQFHRRAVETGSD
ncbi:unnamed protein product, partial [Iphiclides podalirius]